MSTTESNQKIEGRTQVPPATNRMISEQLKEIDAKMNTIACEISDMSNLIDQLEQVSDDKKDFEKIERMRIKYTNLFVKTSELSIKKRIILREAREIFMDIFRLDEFHDIVTVDDAHEVFAGVLHGECDFTKEFLDEIFSDYSVSDIEIIERK